MKSCQHTLKKAKNKAAKSVFTVGHMFPRRITFFNKALNVSCVPEEWTNLLSYITKVFSVVAMCILRCMHIYTLPQNLFCYNLVVMKMMEG